MSSFDSLPTEVHRTILSFMDIASLSSLSSTQRPTEYNISSLASDDTTWYTLVQRRFGIGCYSRKRQSKKEGVILVRRYSSSSLLDSSITRAKRPMSYGGSTWKEAYRSLAATMRIPECTATSATVFASPSKYRFQTKGHRTAYSKRGSQKAAVDYLGVWCLLNHAEDCCTKAAPREHRIAANSSDERRYIEMKLCLQNTKSAYGCITIPDVRNIRFVTVNEEEGIASCGCVSDACIECAPSLSLVNHGRWAPKVLLHKRFKEYERCTSQMKSNELVLNPLEFVVLSIHLSCRCDMIYETDVLSTLSSIRVPVVPHIGWQQQQCGSGVATAHFLPEDLLWDYYCQLPGGCLSLIDRSRLVPV